MTTDPTPTEPRVYAVLARVQKGRPHRAVALRTDKAQGQEAARAYRKAGWPEVKLRLLKGAEAIRKAEADIEWVDSKTWDGDHAY